MQLSAQVCPVTADIVEVFIFLQSPCHICQLLLTIAHGLNDESSPASFDVRAGQYIDSLKLVLEGATIPRCASGTKLLYLLPGVGNSKDAAITGAGAVGGGQTQFPWLYEFEEQEGEVDFLTRILAITFYPASPGSTAMTLGEVEVLGFSLPWERVLSKDEHWVEVLAPEPENGDANSCRKNPFLVSEGELNGRGENVNGVENSFANSFTGGHGLDLLTGDAPTPSQPAMFETSNMNDTVSMKPSSSWDLLFSDSSDPFDTFEDPLRKIEDMSADVEIKMVTDDYLESVKLFCGSTLTRRPEFLEAVELEIIRFGLGLSAADRDRLLLSIGKDPVSVDPNRLLPSSYAAQVSQTAVQLAAINYIALEDEILSRIGLEDLELSFGGNNGSDGCEVHEKWSDRLRPHSRATGLAPCRICHLKACANCRVCKEEATLAGSFGGLAGNTAAAFQMLNWEDSICKKCCPQVILDALHLDYLKTLGSERRKGRIKHAAASAIKEIYGDNLHLFSESHDQDFDIQRKQLEELLMGEKSLAEYPHASLLATVPSAETSESCLSLLASPFVGSQDSYWKAPSNITNVMLAIVLSTPSAVSGLVLLVSSCGYSPHDMPILEVWSGNWITETDRTFIGRWDFKSLVTAAPHLYGQQISGGSDRQSLRALCLKFKKSEECRMLWLKFTLQNFSKASLDSKFDLISLGTPSIKQRSSGGALDPPCIHARRIVVVGSHFPEISDSLPPVPISMKQAWRNSLEQPVTSGRFKVQVEAEAYRESDRVVEQAFPVAAPSISGFRLDSLYTIKNTLKFIPTKLMSSLDSILDSVEGLLINPGSLFISLSAVQEDRPRAHVGYFSLPISQPATPLYFDFGTPIQARELTFELLGDITAYSDERSEQQNDAPVRDPPIASGLSLANKIRVYRYALVSEMGKWALLSAI